MKRVLTRTLIIVPGVVLLGACGGGDKPTGPSYGPPTVSLLNGVTKATGLVGMTVVIEGNNFATPDQGAVYFTATDGTPIQATVNSSDWANTYIVTTVPQGVANNSVVWVKTQAGTSDSLEFDLISGNTFSPSLISWKRTVDLPHPLQGLGAAFVPVEHGNFAKFIYTVGGAADSTNVATSVVYRAQVLETGAISAWDNSVTPLPSPRAYAATAAATLYTANIDTSTAGYLYAIGGVDSTGTVVNTVLYSRVAPDGSLGTWQSATALPAAVHSAAALVYRGYLYVIGGSDAQNKPTASAYRAQVKSDGSLGSWQPIASLAAPTAYHAVSNFGPYVYVVAGDTGTVGPATQTMSTTETGAAYLGKIDMRTGDVASWVPVTAATKARAKHGVMSAGGSVVVTSGLYAGGTTGSSENSYAMISSDGTLGSWAGATGSSTIASLLGYSIYNEAAVSFTDATGTGHVVVLGGANNSTGRASAGVVYY